MRTSACQRGKACGYAEEILGLSQPGHGGAFAPLGGPRGRGARSMARCHADADTWAPLSLDSATCRKSRRCVPGVSPTNQRA
jgi:hypothetical protein